MTSPKRHQPPWCGFGEHFQSLRMAKETSLEQLPDCPVVRIAAMARVLGVSKAGPCARLHRAPSAHATADTAVPKRIRTVHVSSRQTCGAPRVHAGLRAGGERHGRRRIARPAREGGRVGAGHRHGGPATTRRDREARPAPDLVDRDLTASGPNQPRVADITTVPTTAGFLTLTLVLDAWSRGIVGGSVANPLHAEPVLERWRWRRPAAAQGRHPPQRPGQPVHVPGVRQASKAGATRHSCIRARAVAPP